MDFQSFPIDKSGINSKVPVRQKDSPSWLLKDALLTQSPKKRRNVLNKHWWIITGRVDADELQSKCILLMGCSQSPCFYLFIYLLSTYSRKSAFLASNLKLCFLNVHYLIHSGPVAIDESILKLKFYLFSFAFFRSPLTQSDWEIVQPCKWHKLLVLLPRKTNFNGFEFPSSERRGDVIRHAVPTRNNSIHLFTIESSSLHCRKKVWSGRSVAWI